MPTVRRKQCHTGMPISGRAPFCDAQDEQDAVMSAHNINQRTRRDNSNRREAIWEADQRAKVTLPRVKWLEGEADD